jgi:hypothetical protein
MGKHRFTLAITSALLFSACSPKASTTPPVLQVAGFESFVQKFQDQSATEGNPVTVNNLIIQFGTMTSTAERGVCETSSAMTPTITLDQDYWENVDTDAQESLVFHEMGHCVRNRVHVDTLQTTGDPSSDMYPYTIDGPTYVRNEKIYYPELFLNGPYFTP